MHLKLIKQDRSIILMFWFYGSEMYSVSYEHKFDYYNKGGSIRLKNTFFLNKLRATQATGEETLHAQESSACKIAELHDDYYELNKDVFDIQNSFYFHKSIDFNLELFYTEPKVSIIKYIDDVLNCSVYIGGDVDNNNLLIIPKSEYLELIKRFPNNLEIKKYRQKRIIDSISDFVNIKSKYYDDYDNYLNRRLNTHKSGLLNVILNSEQLKFKSVLEIMNDMLENEQNYSEADWQKHICNVLQLLFPKYVRICQNVFFEKRDSKRAFADIMLVDYDGYVDLIEIKKPFKINLLNKVQYRGNYFPSHELSGSIMQLESYLIHMNKLNYNDIQKIKSRKLPEYTEELKVQNPKGMIIAGRTNHFNSKQIEDFDLIKRKYANIMDILSYDDLLRRLNAVVNSF